MAPILSTLLLAATATGQLTTSIWLLKTNIGTDKIGFYGSVIGASGSTTTLQLVYDNGTDRSALGLRSRPSIVTVAPSMFEIENNLGVGAVSLTQSNAEIMKIRCEAATAPADAVPTCTQSYGPALARGIQCQRSGPNSTSTLFESITFTYSGRRSYSAGVETVVRTYLSGPNTMSIPDWCSQSGFYPSGWATTETFRKENFATYQVVITAGQEKLSATTASGASVTNVSSTGPVASGSASTPTGSVASAGAAMPMRTAGPVMVGLGAAVAAFVV